jgi:hypothetical protein
MYNRNKYTKYNKITKKPVSKEIYEDTLYRDYRHIEKAYNKCLNEVSKENYKIFLKSYNSHNRKHIYKEYFYDKQYVFIYNKFKTKINYLKKELQKLFPKKCIDIYCHKIQYNTPDEVINYVLAQRITPIIEGEILQRLEDIHEYFDEIFDDKYII